MTENLHRQHITVLVTFQSFIFQTWLPSGFLQGPVCSETSTTDVNVSPRCSTLVHFVPSWIFNGFLFSCCAGWCIHAGQECTCIVVSTATHANSHWQSGFSYQIGLYHMSASFSPIGLGRWSWCLIGKPLWDDCSNVQCHCC